MSHQGPAGRQVLNCQAIWDTGATNSVIPSQVVDSLDLKPIDVRPFKGFDGKSINCSIYLVDIVLPNKFIVPGVQVAGGPAITGAEVLIGMDIIGLGDFVITNLKGKTQFTFRMPSMFKLDFVKDIRQEKAKNQRRLSGVRAKRKLGRKNKQAGRKSK